MAFHARPRFTKDLDLWVEDSEENLTRVQRALDSFGAPPGLADELRNGASLDVVWMGRPPNRVDLVKAIPGVAFADAFSRRVVDGWHGVQVSIISRDDLILAKKASGREQDLLDVQALERPGQPVGRR